MNSVLLRIIQILLGSAGIVIFTLPVILDGVFNLGTIVGIISFLAVLLWGIFRNRIIPFLAALRESKGWNRVISVVGILIEIVLIFAVVESGFMIMASKKEPTDDAVTAVVLGCSVRGEEPGEMLMQRIDAAETYLKANPNVKCILCGGQGEGEDITEASCMYRELVKRGINPGRLYKEEQSTSTRANFTNAKKIISRNGMYSDLVVITHEFHQYRSASIAGKFSFTCYAVNAKTDLLLLPTYWVRELFGIVNIWIQHFFGSFISAFQSKLPI